MAQWLCTIAHHGLAHFSEAQNELNHAIDEMESQLENEYGGNYHRYRADGEQIDTNAPWNLDEEQYIKDSLREIEQKGLAQAGDAWMIVDDIARFGYGASGYTYDLPDGGKIWGGRVAYTPEIPGDDPIETFRNLAIHEMGHNFNTDHEDGTYYQFLPGADVTPMATSYTISDDGVADTYSEGSGTHPYTFCDNGTPYGPPLNYTIPNWCGGSDDPCRHTSQMTPCTMSTIDSNTPR